MSDAGPLARHPIRYKPNRCSHVEFRAIFIWRSFAQPSIELSGPLYQLIPQKGTRRRMDGSMSLEPALGPLGAELWKKDLQPISIQ
jgi:hypothetical protein